MVGSIYFLVQANTLWHCVVSNTEFQPQPSSYFSFKSSMPATSPSSSPEQEHQPSPPLMIRLDRPPHHQYPEQRPQNFRQSENVVPPSSQSISDGDSAQPATTTTQLQQADSTNQSYKYPPPFDQILVESGLGKILLGADLSALLAMIVLVNKDESIGLWARVVCLLLLIGSLALFFALLLKELYPAIAMVTVLIGIGCSIAAICAYPLSVFLPHLWVTVLSSIVALSVMIPIMIIFCWKKCEREES